MVARPERDPLPRKPSYPLLPPCAFGADTADGGVVLTPLTPICAAERGINTCSVLFHPPPPPSPALATSLAASTLSPPPPSPPSPPPPSHPPAQPLHPSPLPRALPPLSSILHLLPHGDPLRRSRGEPYTQTRTATTMPEPPAERSSARSPSPLCAHTLYRTHVRAAPIRPPRGPGQTHPHVLSPSGLPRAAWEASLFTFSL